jgi:glycosyltransferase involved in cell wall biosynthesis
MQKKLLIVINVDWFFLSHFLPIALFSRKMGWQVTVVTCNTGKKEEIESYGLRFIELPFKRSGTNIWYEAKCVCSLIKLLKKERPNIVHNITLKAVLLSSVAAKILGKKQVLNAVTGFGYNFTDNRNDLKQMIIKQMMSLAFKSKHFHFIFENPDDIQQFKTLNFALENNIHLIKGAGVDLQQFTFEKEVLKEKVRLLLPARMLKDKGVFEFIEAAKKIKKQCADKAEFILAGDCDTLNLAGIQEEELDQALDAPYIRWIGFQKNAYQFLKETDIVVLPSYREGLPKSLIEACALGRPIITTDTQGCRECVLDGWNGYLVPVKDTEILSQKMELLINDKEKREIMGKNSRLLAERDFSISKIVESFLNIYEIILKQ